MGSSIKIGRVFGVEVGVHWSWIIIFGVVTATFATGVFDEFYSDWSETQKWVGGAIVALVFFLSVLAHELSHAIVSNRTGLPVNSITLFVFGGVANLTREPDNPGQEFRIAIVGPLTSFVLGTLFAAAWAIVYQFNDGVAGILLNLAVINVSLGVFNMLPGYPLDGGRVFRSVLWMRNQNRLRATRTAARAGEVLGYALMGIGVLEMVMGYFGGAWTLFIGFFLRNVAAASYEQLATESALDGVLVRDVMRQDFETVDPVVTVGELVEQHVLLKNTRSFAVLAGGEFAGLVTLTDVRAVPRDQWASTSVYRAMTPATRLHTVAPDQTLADVLRLMAEHDINQLPVLDRHQLVGMLTRGDLVRFLQMRKDVNELRAEESTPKVS